MASGSRILIVGGGYSGMRTALCLERLHRARPLVFPREVECPDVLKHRYQDFKTALRVIVQAPSGSAPLPGRREGEAVHHAYRQ